MDGKGAWRVREDKKEESGEGKKGLERKSTRLDQLDDLSKLKYSQSREEESKHDPPPTTMTTTRTCARPLSVTMTK